MDDQSPIGPTGLLAHIVGDIADALAGRPGESQARQDERARTAAGTILQFRPRDAVEAMISGHCVIFHELIVDGVQDMSRVEDPTARRATRSAIVAMDRAFGANLTRLERYRAREVEGVADEQPLEHLCETQIADRVKRHRPGTPERAPDGVPASAATDDPPAGAAGMADPECPTGSKETDQPSEAWLANAATQLAGLNRQARREFGRQARKRIGAAAGRADLSAMAPTRRG